MLNAGDRFGDYTVVRLLGQGGMGAVYLLENAGGGKVAAKILDPKSAGDHESRKRFLREAELALGVKHANLVETYDVGEDPETELCYILMEYVSGGSLADRIKAGPLAIDEAVRITCQIASVLELARQKGIVHRDIKPANIMFGADGTAKLADLGIARSGIGGTETTTVTQTGMMIGTPAYMAPEQMLDAHNVDSRADIYSLGIVFYEMLTGQRPNKGDTVVQLMAKAVAGEPIPDVRRLRPEVSAAVAELISLMCAMKVDERIATPAEVATAIAQIAHRREVTIRRKRPSAAAVKKSEGAGGNLSRKVIFVVLGVVAAVGVAAFAYLGWHANKTTVPPPVVVQTNVVEKIVTSAPPPVVTQTNVVEKAVERTHVVTNDVGKVEVEHRPKTAKSADWRSLVRLPQGEILSAQVGGYTWYYQLNELGHAVLVRRGTDEKGTLNPLLGCVSPVPTGALEVPRELDGHPLTGIGSSALEGCRELTSVTLPEGLVFVDACAFQHCVGLVSVKIPDSLKSLGFGTFRNCSALRTMDLNLVEEIRGGAGLEYAQEIRIAPGNPIYVLEDGVLYAQNKTVLVYYPPDRTELVLPKTVTEVFCGAFVRSKMRSLTLPDSIECVDPFAFPMSALREIRFGRNLKKIKASAFGACNLVRVIFEGDAPEVIPEPWRSEGGMLFVPSDWRWIANRADLTVYVHKGSKGWTAPGQTGLPKLWPVSDRPEGSRPIRYIEDGMEALPDETAPAVPKQREQSVNKPVRFDRRVRFAEVEGRTWFYTLENDEAVIWRGENGYNNDTRPAVRPDPEGHVVVPAELDGHKVVAIGSLAFFRCRKMSSVKIPEGVRELRGWVFHDCDALAEVYLPKSLKRIESDAFCYCRSLKSFDIGVCPDVPGLAFRMCDSLASVTAAPDNPSYVSRNGALFDRTESTLVFYPRTRRSAEVPASVRVIGKGAFCNSPIERIALPDSVERICEDAFFACGSLREITFGAGLKEIDESAFWHCGKLRRLDFPRSLKKLGKALTDGCRSLENVVFRGDAPEIDAQQTLFGKIPESTVIDVMLGTRGWNGPGSTDLPKLWPLGNFEDSRPIRHAGRGDDPSARPRPDVQEKPKAQTVLPPMRIKPDFKSAACRLELPNGVVIKAEKGCRVAAFTLRANLKRVFEDAAAIYGWVPLRKDPFVVTVSRNDPKVCSTADFTPAFDSWSIRLAPDNDCFEEKLAFLAATAFTSCKDPDWMAFALYGAGLIEERMQRERFRPDFKALARMQTDNASAARQVKLWRVFEEMRKRNPRFFTAYCRQKNRRFYDGSLGSEIGYDAVVELLSTVQGVDVGALFRKEGLGDLIQNDAPAGANAELRVPPNANDGKTFNLAKMRGTTFPKTLQNTLDQVFPPWRLDSDYQGMTKTVNMQYDSGRNCGYSSRALGRNHVVVLPLNSEASVTVLSCRRKIEENDKLKCSFAFGPGASGCEFVVKANGHDLSQMTFSESVQWEDFDVDLSKWKGKNVRIDIVISCVKNMQQNSRGFLQQQGVPLLYFQRLEFGK